MNESNAAGIFDQAKGKVKEALGETFDNQKLANEGAADQVKGHAKEAWGNIKDTASDIKSTKADETHAETDSTAHDLRSKVTNAAASVKESINHGLEKLENDHAHK